MHDVTKGKKVGVFI